MPLSLRIHRYLVNHPTEWIHERAIKELAKKHGYSYEAIRIALEKVRHMLDVGIQWVSVDTKQKNNTVMIRGQWYVGYKMSKDELKERERVLRMFDEA